MENNIQNNLIKKFDLLNIIKKQKYSIIGNHSAVKTCLWLKKSIYNSGNCYKSKFYGVKSNQCIQMTPTLLCNQKCIFCWRAIDCEFPKPLKWDKPIEIVDESIKAQLKLITGFGGSKYSNKIKYLEAKEPSNVAISLVGEPTTYPYLDELIEIYNQKNIYTFIVTNGTNSKMIEKINPRQIYISLEATTEELYNKICRPNNKKMWDEILNSLEILNLKKSNYTKTALRITIIKNYNSQYAKEFVKLINLASPNYIEIKSYMHIGFSRFRLERENMVDMQELIKFSMEICKYCNSYKIFDFSEPSRVILLSLIK